MKKKFDKMGERLNLKVIYARADLANVILDNLSHADFNADGLLMIASPVYSTGMPVDYIGRAERQYELSVVSLNELDFDDEDVDKKLQLCEVALRRALKILGVSASTMNVFVSDKDINLCGVFVDVYLSSTKPLCFYDKKVEL